LAFGLQTPFSARAALESTALLKEKQLIKLVLRGERPGTRVFLGPDVWSEQPVHGCASGSRGTPTAQVPFVCASLPGLEKQLT